jgi:hypothetical protein
MRKPTPGQREEVRRATSKYFVAMYLAEFAWVGVGTFGLLRHLPISGHTQALVFASGLVVIGVVFLVCIGLVTNRTVKRQDGRVGSRSSADQCVCSGRAGSRKNATLSAACECDASGGHAVPDHPGQGRRIGHTGGPWSGSCSTP